jgi:hypothetical protein
VEASVHKESASSKSPFTLRAAAMLGILLLVAVIFFVVARAVGMSAQPATSVPGAAAIAQGLGAPSATTDTSEEIITPITSRSFATWEYETTKSSFAGIHSTINYNHASAGDIQAYVTANKALLPEVVAFGGKAQIAVSFLPPLSPADFRAWTKRYGVVVQQAHIAVGSSTAVINGSADDPLPQSVGDTSSPDGSHGEFGAYATVDAAVLTAMAADPRVFLLDVTPAWVQHDLLVSGYADAAKADVYLALPYAWMERLGMVPTPVPAPVRTITPWVGPTAPDN